MESKLQFKLLFDRSINRYQLVFNDYQGRWVQHSYNDVVTEAGELMVNNRVSGFGLISERLLWDMEYLRYLGFEFIGIEEKE